MKRVSAPIATGKHVLAVLALSVATLLALSAGAARAEVPRLVPNGDFAAKGGPLGVAVDNTCHLHGLQPGTKACEELDSSSGDVYTAGWIERQASGLSLGPSEKFDASGRLLSPPSPFAEGVASWGAAVNPMNGDLYVVSSFASEIATYDPTTGILLSSFPVPGLLAGLGEEDFAQIATDSAGDVYVPNGPGNEVLEYGPHPTCSGEPVECIPLKTFTGLKAPTGVAVDSAGDVWIADDGNNRIVELEPGGAPVVVGGKPVAIDSEGVRALALDGHGDVFAMVNNRVDPCGVRKPPCGHLVEYSPTGVQLADVGAGTFGPSRETEGEGGVPLDMVAVDQASGRVYVTDSVKDLVWVFQPPAAPLLGRESAAEVGVSEAKLGALVDPGGLATSYRFEYDTRAYGEGEGPHGLSIPLPEGSVGVGFSTRAVWAGVKDLAPGTTYHYRAVVTNGLDKVVGPDETFTTQSAAQAACPNEGLRGGFSVALPDCRAYELVTPVGRTSFQPDTGSVVKEPFFPGGGFVGNVAARDGDRMSYAAAEVAPGSRTAGLEYVATRGTSGWSSEDVIPLQRYNGDRCTQRYEETIGVLSYSADLSTAVLFAGSGEGDLYCDWEVEVVPGEPMGVQNLLLRDNTDGSYRLIDLAPPGVVSTDATLVAVSADASRVVFDEFARLTPDALTNTVNTYEWSKGAVHLAFVLPSGAPAVGGSFAGISANGADVFFTAGGKLYVRLGGERTVQLDQPRGGSGPGGGGRFAAVTADGSQVFFTADASAGLTGDTHPGSGGNLYRYDVSSGELADLTPVEHTEVESVQISEDGSYVYLSAKGVLSGLQANQLGETAQSGQPNFYLAHGGTVTFILHEPAGARVSADGAYLAFNSTSSLTGYDNVDTNTGNRDPEVYLYSAASNRFACASCNPSGEAPTGGGALLGGRAAFASVGNIDGDVTVPHYVSDDGQVFFQSEEALLPRDTNGQLDVYELDYIGGLHLISSGTSSSESRLLDASASGNDVFFLGRQALVLQDTGGEANRIYDARVNGGFHETAVPPACTTAESCRLAPEPQPPVFGEPASQTFSGAGNLAPPAKRTTVANKAKQRKSRCRKGFAERRGRCVRASLKKKARKSNTNHGGRR